jgi:hypothetical protein
MRRNGGYKTLCDISYLTGTKTPPFMMAKKYLQRKEAVYNRNIIIQGDEK